MTRHCEERSDEAIQNTLATPGLLRFARNDGRSQQVMIYGGWTKPKQFNIIDTGKAMGNIGNAAMSPIAGRGVT